MNIPTPQQLKETEHKISKNYAEQLIKNVLFSIEYEFNSLNRRISSNGG